MHVLLKSEKNKNDGYTRSYSLLWPHLLPVYLKYLRDPALLSLAHLFLTLSDYYIKLSQLHLR